MPERTEDYEFKIIDEIDKDLNTTQRRISHQIGLSLGMTNLIMKRLQDVYKGMTHKKGDFPISEEYSKEILYLPMYPELTKAQIEEIVRAIKSLCEL